jgi:hypothetical protein
MTPEELEKAFQDFTGSEECKELYTNLCYIFYKNYLIFRKLS